MTKYELVVIDYFIFIEFSSILLLIYLHELEIFLNDAVYILFRLSVTFHLFFYQF